MLGIRGDSRWSRACVRRRVQIRTGFTFLCILGGLVACSPAVKETEAGGATDASGYLAFAAHAPAESQHWSTDVALRAAPEGTYALVYSDGAPSSPPVVAPDAFALQCARASGKSCPLPKDGAVVAVTDVGPGGTGMLRAMFAKGDGGWFSVVRVAGQPGTAKVDVRILSEALRAGEKAQRFELEMNPKAPGSSGST